MSKEVKWKCRQTGYDDSDTHFSVNKKDHGTAPDITIYQSGKYSGSLTLSIESAKELAKTLLYITEEKP